MRLHKETSIFSPSRITSGIAAAAQTASNFITAVTSGGIFVHTSDGGAAPTDADAYGVHISDVVKIIRAGVAMAIFGDGDGDTVTLGDSTSGNYAVIDSDSFDVYHESTEMTHFGYGEGTNSSGGTSTNPYYTLGTRASGSTVGNYSTAEGCDNVASGYVSHAEGEYSRATGQDSHAESGSTASGLGSHAEGFGNVASGDYSHVENGGGLFVPDENDTYVYYGPNTASGNLSHAEGSGTTASGLLSHAEGLGTVAAYDYQHVQGKYNDNNSDNAFEVGNGTSNTARSNAFAVDWDGNATVGGSYIDGDGRTLGFTSLGTASSGTATSFTLPASSARYLVLVAHNSTAQSNGLYMVSTAGNAAHKLSSSGSNITVTCSGTTLTVTSSSGTVGVYYERIS